MTKKAQNAGLRVRGAVLEPAVVVPRHRRSFRDEASDRDPRCRGVLLVLWCGVSLALPAAGVGVLPRAAQLPGNQRNRLAEALAARVREVKEREEQARGQ